MKPQPGDIVSARNGSWVTQYRVYRTTADAFAAGETIGGRWTPLAYFDMPNVQEGVDWCHGRCGPEVEALRVAAALT